MKSNYLKQIQRNQGLISNDEQLKIQNATVVIAGVGGDGGLLAERLVRLGVGNLILLDPDTFDWTNLNRQFGSKYSNIGQNKAEAVAKELLEINPFASIQVYSEGLTSDNVIEVVQQADLVIDEIEFSLPEVSVMLHQEARRQGKTVFMGANIGWGASFFYFTPDSMTFEQFFSYDAENKTINTLAYLPTKPDYISDDLLNSVLNGLIDVPALSSSVALVAAVMATDIVRFLAGNTEPPLVPEYKHIDLVEMTPTISKNNYHESSRIAS